MRDGNGGHLKIFKNREGMGRSQRNQFRTEKNIFSEKMNELENFETAIEHKLYSTTGIRIDVKLKEPKTIQRSVGKAKRVWDKRKGEKI